MAGDVLYIGIDLGTFRSVMVSLIAEYEELTVIGTPKDPIARNFEKRCSRRSTKESTSIEPVQAA